MSVQALYIDPRGPYPTLLGAGVRTIFNHNRAPRKERQIRMTHRLDMPITISGREYTMSAIDGRIYYDGEEMTREELLRLRDVMIEIAVEAALQRRRMREEA